MGNKLPTLQETACAAELHTRLVTRVDGGQMPESLSEKDSAGNLAGADKLCGGCHHADKCRQVWSGTGNSPFSPAALSLASAAAFLLPIVCAIAAVWLCQTVAPVESAGLTWQLIAAAGGLGIGALFGWLIVSIIRRRSA